MEVPEQTDVAVIGGGPAGSIAAGILAKKGYQVVLFEKATHPRPAVGESILPHFWRYTDMIGASAKIEEAGFIVKTGGIVKWRETARRQAFRDFGHNRKALHADRDIFDKILLDAARDCGAQVFERHSVVDVDLSGEENKVLGYRVLSEGATAATKTIRARFVVDASGQSAIVAKQMGFREFEPRMKFSALWGYYDGGNYFDYSGDQRPFSERQKVSPVTFVESIGDWGWTWHIVLKNSVSVGMILPNKQMQEFKRTAGSMEQKFHEKLADLPVLGNLLSGARLIDEKVNIIRDYSYKPKTLALNGCYLVGDAACFVDPINSSGVTLGMYAATLAAWAIESSLKNPRRTGYFQEAYDLQYRHRLNMFRLVSMPSEIELTTEELDEISAGFRFFSDAEKQLALTTSILTQRPDNVRKIMDRLGIEHAAIFNEIPVDDLLYGRQAAAS